MKAINNRHYNWNTYINDKAIIEFEMMKGLEIVKLNLNRYYLLSYLVDLYINPKKKDKITTKFINEEKYIYVSSSFILNNLRLLKLEQRSLLRILDQLENLGYIDRVIDKSIYRYIKINDELLQFYKTTNEVYLRPINLQNLADKLARFFGKTMDYQLDEVYEFLNSLADMDYFEIQLDFFIRYKEFSNEIIPRFKNFCQSWDQQNWKNLLEKMEYKEELSRFSKL